MPTTVAYSPLCRLHFAGAGHPERPPRLEAVLEALRAPELRDSVTFVEARPATRDVIERVHPAAYVDRLEAIAAAGGGALDADTYLGPRSWEAVTAAAGTAIAAVDAALLHGTAFAAVRPPGHHALADRAMGFCFLNN